MSKEFVTVPYHEEWREGERERFGRIGLPVYGRKAPNLLNRPPETAHKERIDFREPTMSTEIFFVLSLSLSLFTLQRFRGSH